MSEERKRRADPIPDEHLKGIGTIIVCYAGLENAVKHATGSLIGCDGATGQAITSEMSFRKLIALFSSLCQLKITDPAALDEMRRLVAAANGIDDKRNQIVHSEWGVQYWEDGRLAVVRMKSTAKIDKGLRQQMEELSAADLEDFADRIINATKGWTDFLYKYLMPGSPVEPPYGDEPWT